MELWLWVAFTLFIFAMLGLDLGLLQRRPHVISMKEALSWFGVWTGLALLFNVGIILFHERGGQAGLEFFTGYLVEKSLSMDNVFVFLLIFNFFHVPPAFQHKVLFWGIVGAILLRIVFIVGGLALLEHFHGMVYVFGSFLVLTGLAMMRRKEAHVEPDKNWLIRLARRVVPLTGRFDSNHFFTVENGRRVATPLFIVLLAIESSDIVFAADSIPAIFAITPDPFIVYTSNIFAMLGLRALYFAVAGFMRMFHFLHYGFASIILILGVKMLLTDVYRVPVELSLVLIVFILLICLVLSLLLPRRADLKMLFERTERLGLIPFRRLLLIENIIDLGDLTVRDAMCRRAGVRALQLDAPWADNLATIRATRFSRYPLLDGGARPSGILHVKDLFFQNGEGPLTPARLRQLARPCLEVPESLPLEELLARLRKRYDQMALVLDAQGQWTGIITSEDALEEIVGKIGDEFDPARAERPVSLSEALAPERIVLGLHAESMPAAIAVLVARIPAGQLPLSADKVVEAVLKREEAMPTYVGNGLAIPHARLEGIARPIIAFARSDEGISLDKSAERVELIFLLLAPSGMARVQPRLLADIAALFESEYVAERLRRAQAPEDVLEAIKAAEEVAID